MADELLTSGGGQGFPADNPDGTPGLVGPDEYTKQSRIARILGNNTTVLTGNIADVQRAGAEAATGKADKSVDTGPGVDPKSDKIVTPAQAEAARGEWTRETERTGLLDAPVVPEPKENKSPDPVDPTSTSPRAESKTASGTSTSTAAKK